MRRYRALPLLGLLLAVAACGGEDSLDKGDAPPAAVASPSPSPYDAYAGLPTGDVRLQVPGACRAFYEAASDLTLTDEQLAARFVAIASRTKDKSLSVAIEVVGRAYAERQEQVFSSRVSTICTYFNPAN